MLLMLLADGFEEIEALGTLDLLRRAGVEVQTASLAEGAMVQGAHGITVQADGAFPGAWSPERVEGVILPGGMGGATALAASAEVEAWLRALNAQGKWICAICAAPALVLPRAGVLTPGRQATCYPAADFIAALGAAYTDAPAVVSGNLITGAGPGAFADFARAIAEALCPAERVAQVWQDALL
ncbi:MAG: DJ-1 family glyoxalase III [Candidatus Spyradenecus sp.]